MSYGIVFAALIAVKIYTAYGLQCYNCRDISDPSSCQTTTTCGAGQSCFEESRPTHSGKLYSMGCSDSQICGSTQTHVLIGRSVEKRQSAVCFQCCSANNCNANLCSPGHGTSGSFLLVMDSNQLYKIDVPTHGVAHSVLQASSPQTLDYDYVDKVIYWFDSSYNEIRRQPFNSTQNTYQRVIPVVTSDYGFAVDRMSKLLFYTRSSPVSSINVVSLETGKAVTLIDTGLSSPQAIALDLNERKIYWADSSSIEVSNYNGTNRHTVISGGLQRPVTLVLDDENNILYWADAGTHKIEKANTNGTNRQTLFARKGVDYTGLALLGKTLYYTSTFDHTVMNLPTTGGSPEAYGKSSFRDLHDIKAYDLFKLPMGGNACSIRNGGCSHVCIPTSDTTRECICALGYLPTSNSTSCTKSTLVRLAGRNSTPLQGRVELSLDNGATWNTFCSGLSQNDANVMCSMLGLEASNNAVISYDQQLFGSANSSFGVLNSPDCKGTEDSVNECQQFPFSSTCSHYYDYGINCTSSGKVRLVDSNAKDQGRVEIRINNQWGTICDDNFGSKEAGVVCGMLGFSRNGAVVKTRNYFGEASTTTPIHMDNVNCKGNEDSLLECQHNEIIDVTDCEHSEDVGVICQAVQFMDVRLVGSTASSNQGTVEISTDNGQTWSTICDDYFADLEAQVVCHMLGFNRLGAVAVGAAYYGQGNSNSKIQHFDCFGPETSLQTCREISGSCSHSEDVGVRCPYSNTEQIRLVDGPTTNQGRIELSLDNGATWRSVCSTNFGIEEAKVVCGVLGYPRFGAMSKGYNYYPQGTSNQDPILYQPVCNGTETSLMECGRSSTSSCSHVYDVGVLCVAEPTTFVRLVYNQVFGTGRIEITFDNGTNWGTICNDYFGPGAAEVLCRMLGFNSVGAAAVTNGSYGVGTASQPILLDDVYCDGDETSVLQCKHRPLGEHDCSHDEDVGVACVVNGIGSSSVRLTGSTSQYQGRVEIKIGDMTGWGTICDDSFDNSDASVICAMLGFQRVGAIAKDSAFFGQGQLNQPILLDDLLCDGSELSLLSCPNVRLRLGYHNCGHNEDAGVICQP